MSKWRAIRPQNEEPNRSKYEKEIYFSQYSQILYNNSEQYVFWRTGIWFMANNMVTTLGISKLIELTPSY